MARFERSKGKKKDYRNSSKKRSSRFGDSENNPRGRRSFEESPRERRFSGRESSRNSRNRRDFEMTSVTCSSCGNKCEVPFKPTSSKPVYCGDCFKKQDKGGSDRHSNFDRHPRNSSNKDLEIINEKLNKILKALDIE